MKKIIVLLLTISLFIPTLHTEAAASTGKITEVQDLIVDINGNTVRFDVPPAMKSDRLLVPIRAIFEAMGAEVNWDNENQTVSAIKNETSIKLVIDSEIAVVNDMDDHILDVPATLYKDRTLVPLRFVGEAFGGTVNWNSESKNVNILLEEPSLSIENKDLFLNSKKLDFGKNTPIVRNNMIYVPITSVLEQVTGDVYWKTYYDSLQTEIDGKNIDFYIGQNYIKVNDEHITINESPFEENGMMYVSMNTIVNHIGIHSHYVVNDNDIQIYITREKFKHEFLTKETGTISDPTNVKEAKFVGNRRMMVSDNPENLNSRTIPDVNSTLWHDKVQSSSSSVDHRVFGWHINEFPQNLNIGITIENLSSTNEIEIVGLEGASRQTPNSWVNYDVGLPLAEYVLSDQMTKVNMNSTTVKSGEALLMKALLLKEDYTIGFSYDFTIKKKSGTGELNYIIRTVASKNETDLSTIRLNPVDIDLTARHPRGVWTSSQLETELPPYLVGSGEVGFQLSNGVTDNLMSPENGIGDQSDMIRNPGHFGASYVVKIPIVNQTGDSKTVRLRIGARGGIYNGAIKLNNKVYLTPTIAPMTEVVNVVDYVADKSDGFIELEIVHAGGSALPIAINLITLDQEVSKLDNEMTY